MTADRLQPGAALVPISPFLDGFKCDPETRRVMGVAFEMACVALRLSNRDDIANQLLAKRIIDLAKTGERNPDLLCENVLKEFREGHQSSGQQRI